MPTAKLRSFCLLALLGAAALAIPPSARAQTPVFTTLHSFTYDEGSDANTLVQAADGNFYGTAASGGTAGNGIVFKMTPAGAVTVLHDFSAYPSGSSTGNSDGAVPSAALLQGKDGSFYGTAEFGGTGGSGTVFKITAAGAFTLLHSFSAKNETDPDGDPTNGEGELPDAALVQAGDGNFYGAASRGGANDQGTLFKMTPAGAVTVLHTFSHLEGAVTNTDGSGPTTLVVGKDGNLYGLTGGGGQFGTGTLFKITLGGVLTVLHHFSALDEDDDNNDGWIPFGPLVQGTDGDFYGTALHGGTHDQGTIYRVTPAGVFTALHEFTGFYVSPPGNIDGALPRYGLIQGADGDFYGTALAGGAANNGVVFKITSAGQLTNLHAFSALSSSTNSDGADPEAGLVLAKDGGYYGVTNSGGREGGGTVFKIAYTPAITSATSAAATTGSAFSYQITALNTPASYGAANLPPGLSINQATGKISGTPTKAGTYGATIAAFNKAGSGSAKLTFTVKAGVARPVITSSLNPPSRQGIAFAYQITATNNPTKYGESGIPAGLSINQTTGRISGTPTKAGTYNVTIAAFNSAGSGTAKLTLTVKPAM